MESSLLLSKSNRKHGVTTKLIPLIILALIPAIVLGLLMSFGYGQNVVATFSHPSIVVPIEISELDVIFIFISVAFGISPIFCNNIGQFKKYTKDKTEEYRWVRKIVSIEIPILIVLTIFY